MTETTLFNATTDQTTTVDPLLELVGEDKKFKTTSDLAKGKLEADKFIDTLKDDNKKLRDELAARARLEEVLDRIEAAGNNQRSDDGTEYRTQENPTTGDLDKLLERKLSEHEDRKRKQDNIRQVKTKLEELLGPENFDSKLKARITELQLDENTVTQLAAASPTAALKLLGATQGATDHYYSPPASTVSITTNTTRQGTDRTEAYYNDLKKKDSKLYWSEKVQVQMHNDAVRLGERFFQ